ncbi:hypothetical protein [Streptomyces sp. NPDC001530]|uniref:hypothetical protein n=1 Tax=Streptomyces sp. NPDC001530 TaxID=3364582 RepID=UPI00368F6D75
MSTRMSRNSRTLAAMVPIVTAVMVGGLVTAGPASSAAPAVGTVSFSGKVTCKTQFPNPNTSVPKQVSLESDEDDASGPANSPANRRATFGPIDLDVPLDSTFDLTVTVTCKASGKQPQEFTRTIQQADLTEGDQVKLNIK